MLELNVRPNTSVCEKAVDRSEWVFVESSVVDASIGRRWNVLDYKSRSCRAGVIIVQEHEKGLAG